MKLLRDPLGRPIKRLYFKTEELDDRCERIVVDFMDLPRWRLQASDPDR